MWKKLLKAARFAKKAHAGQTRAHGTPYFSHPAAVARMLWNWGERDSEMLQAAYLHDTLEDTDTKLLTLVQEFGVRTSWLVAVLTKQKGESKRAYFERIRDAGPAAQALKFADRTHNNSELKFVTNPVLHAHLSAKAAEKTALMREVFTIGLRNH